MANDQYFLHRKVQLPCLKRLMTLPDVRRQHQSGGLPEHAYVGAVGDLANSFAVSHILPSAQRFGVESAFDETSAIGDERTRTGRLTGVRYWGKAQQLVWVQAPVPLRKCFRNKAREPL
jgi:hypothetical protein